MKKWLCILSLFGSLHSFAYDGDPGQQVNQFFKAFSTGKTSESVDNLYASNPAMQQKLQAIALVKQQLDTVSVLFGPFLGHENIAYEELSPSLVRIVEVAKHELHPVIWEFYFYKPKKSWMVSQAMFVDQFQVVGSKK